MVRENFNSGATASSEVLRNTARSGSNAPIQKPIAVACKATIGLVRRWGAALLA